MLCLGRSQGTTFTMIPPRLFHKMSLLYYTGLGQRVLVELNPNILAPDAIIMHTVAGPSIN